MNEKRLPGFPYPYFSNSGKVCFWILAAGITVLLPILLARLHFPWISNTYGDSLVSFELFGLTGSIFLIILALWRLRGVKTIIDASQALLPVLTLFLFLTIIPELSITGFSWDFQCYFKATNALLLGNDLYTKCYIYPPLVAQILSQVYLANQEGLKLLGRSDPQATWGLVFYFFQTSQFFLLIGLILLCERLGRKWGLSPTIAAIVSSAVLIFNNPLFRTLRHQQINLWVLDLILVVILIINRSPFLSGLLLAIAGHLKLYSLLMLIPIILQKRWKVLLGIVMGLIGIGILAPLKVWDSFWHNLTNFPTFDGLFRNNSLRNLVASLLDLLGLEQNWLINGLVIILSLVILFWFGQRYIKREYLGGEKNVRLTAHLIDAIAFSLLFSPLLWEHHFVFAIPLVIWSLASSVSFGNALEGKKIDRQVILIGLSIFLMLVLPTFDVFILSYHRIVGLILWIWITQPGWNNKS